MQVDAREDVAQLKDLLEHTLKPRGNDTVTAQSDLWAHSRINQHLRNAALTLQGSDVYKKVKPPGDTTLYKCVALADYLQDRRQGIFRKRDDAWTLESVASASARPSAQQAEHFSAAQLAMAFTLPPGHHVLPEAAKGARVQPPR